MKQKRYYLILLLLIVLISCSTPKYSIEDNHFKIVRIAPGPEDMVLDTFSGKERIIIACTDRRNDLQGNIYSLNIHNNEISKFYRINEPENYEIKPLGIDIFKFNNEVYLLVVSRDFEMSKIVKYKISGNNLEFIKDYKNEMIDSPNAVTFDGKDGFYISNDKIFKGDIIHTKFNSESERIISKLKFPNGVIVIDSLLIFAETTGNRIKMQNLQNKKIKKVCRIKGADNIKLSGDKILVSGHPSFFRFFYHRKSQSKKSPSRIYEINIKNKSKKLLFSDSGATISAASTALICKDKFYISQIFDDFIIVIDLIKD